MRSGAGVGEGVADGRGEGLGEGRRCRRRQDLDRLGRGAAQEQQRYAQNHQPNQRKCDVTT